MSLTALQEFHLYDNGLEITDKNGKLKRVQFPITDLWIKHPRDIGVIAVQGGQQLEIKIKTGTCIFS